MKIFIACIAAIIAQSNLIAQKSSNLNQINANNKFIIGDQNFKLKPTSVNSDKNEIAITAFRDKYLILSDKRYQHAKVKKDAVTNNDIPNILCTDVYFDKDLKNPNLFSRLLDSDLNEGYITFNEEENTAYLTRKKTTTDNGYFLHLSVLEDENKGIWSEPKEVLFDGKSIEINSPRLSTDGKILYFSAKLKDSYGGLDIYKADNVKNNGFSNIQNLGPIVNSNQDEKSPIEFENQLYFASNIAGGLGGFDLYRVSNLNTNPKNKINLGNKINSSKDEINIIPFSQNEGYLTTNNNAETFDIYRYHVENLNLIVETTFFTDKNENIKNLFVDVYDENDKLIFSGSTNSNGNIQIRTKALETLTYKFSNQNYSTNNPLVYTTIGNNEKEYNSFILNTKKIENPIVNNNISTNNNNNTNDIAFIDEKVLLNFGEVYNIYFDFDTYNIKKTEVIKLEEVVKMLKDHPDAVVTIQGHTDRKGSKEYNMELSKKRAQIVKEYLKRNGINTKNINTKALGKTHFAENCEECTPEQDALNRRANFVVDKQ